MRKKDNDFASTVLKIGRCRGSDEILLKSSSEILFYLTKSGTKLVVFLKLYF